MDYPDQKQKVLTNSQQKYSKHNRFAIDPLEQLNAQRWARQRNWQVLGSAHSHPEGNGFPSLIDRQYAVNPGLMVIVEKDGSINAWWMKGDLSFQPINLYILPDNPRIGE